MIPLYDTVPRRHPAFVVWLLVAVNSIIFFLETRIPTEQIEPFLYSFGLVPAHFPGLSLSAFVPFVSYMFLHGSVLHLVGNMWVLAVFGDNVEDRLGHARFLFFYLICGIAAGGIQFATNISSPLPTIGASGAVAGIMGAYFVMFPASRVLALIPIFIFPLILQLPATVFLLLWFLSQLFSGAMGVSGTPAGGIAWWAHAGGFILGAALQRLFIAGRKEGPPA